MAASWIASFSCNAGSSAVSTRCLRATVRRLCKRSSIKARRCGSPSNCSPAWVICASASFNSAMARSNAEIPSSSRLPATSLWRSNRACARPAPDMTPSSLARAVCACCRASAIRAACACRVRSPASFSSSSASGASLSSCSTASRNHSSSSRAFACASWHAFSDFSASWQVCQLSFTWPNRAGSMPARSSSF